MLFLLASAANAATYTVCAVNCDYPFLNQGLASAVNGDVYVLMEDYQLGAQIDITASVTIRGATVDTVPRNNRLNGR